MGLSDNLIAFHDSTTGTITYLLMDPSSKKAASRLTVEGRRSIPLSSSSCSPPFPPAVIDPVLGYDAVSGRTDEGTVQVVLDKVAELGLAVVATVETHAHADHISAAPIVKRAHPAAKAVIGAHIADVQKIFAPIFNLTEEEVRGGAANFDCFLNEGDVLEVGGIKLSVMHTPGHTPACVSYYSQDLGVVFCGDTLFMPDAGSARCDFPGGSSHTLWQSVQKLLALPEETVIATCHDYGKGGARDYAWLSTVKEQKEANIHVKSGTVEDEFIQWRSERDATLSLPKLIVPSIQCNIRAGQFPTAESNGQVYLKTPVNKL